jgi:hypothetical protein
MYTHVNKKIIVIIIFFKTGRNRGWRTRMSNTGGEFDQGSIYICIEISFVQLTYANF